MDPRHEWGREAENKALEWFLEQRMTSQLIARNYRCRWGEIDLIFEELRKDRGIFELVFVEVRARSPRTWVSGLQSVGWKKRQSLRRTADHFLVKYQGLAKTVRFDLLYWDGKIWSYLPNFWLTD